MRIDCTFRRAVLLATSLSGLAPLSMALAQTPQTPSPGEVTRTSNPGESGPFNGSSPGNGTSASAQTPNNTNLEPAQQTVQVEKIRKVYQQLLQKEKDITTAVTEISAKQIQQAGITGSIQSVLTQAPSVNSYQQGIGQNSTELTIRGVEDSLLATSLDDIPTQSLLNGGTSGSFVGQASSFATNDEIGAVNIYPGIAAPDNQGFNALGGTVAYETKKPTADRNFEVDGGVGSFNLWHGGFEANSGALGGVDGLRILLHYDQSYNGGYQDYTPSRYRDFLFNADKPYDGGLSHVTATVTYNTGFTYSTARNPVPVDLLNQNGSYWNFPRTETYNQLNNTFLFADVGDETYINPHLIVSAKIFYEREDDTNIEYENANEISPENPYPNPSSPFFFNDIDTSGAIQPARAAGLVTYDPGKVFGYQTRPLGYDTVALALGDIPPPPYAINGQTFSEATATTQTFGLRPRINIFLPLNTITIGGLATRADETEAAYTYGGTNPTFPASFGYNDLGGLGNVTGDYPGGLHRTILDVYAQDKIDLFHNTLHLLPGATLQTAVSSFDTSFSSSAPTAGSLSSNVYNKDFLPYFGASYDITKHINIYGDYARYDLFAPVNTYSPIVNANDQQIGVSVPSPESLHDYEGGIRYDSSRLLVNLDYYYEKAEQLIGFYENFSNGEISHGNPGAEEFKGVELNATWKISPDWSVFATGSYNLSKYLMTNQPLLPGCECYLATVTPQDGQFGLAYGDTPLSTTPNWLANFGFEYQHTHVFIPNDHFDLRVYGHYVGEQYITEDNLAFPQQTNEEIGGATRTDTSYRQPAYTTFNLLATYDLPVHKAYVKDVTFALNVQNLFDLKYYQYEYLQIGTFGYGAYGGNEFKTAVPGIPADITFDVAAKF